MDASLLIRLIDQVTGPAGKVVQSVQSIRDVVGEFGRGFSDSIRSGFSVENIEQATRNAELALSQARSRLLGAIGTVATLAAPARLAAQFDQSMKGLEKVLDDLPVERLARLRKFALDTSAIVPIAARDVIELMAEAAQGGVPTDDLEAFSLYVANAAVAFDMAGQEIGERFAKLRNVYRLNQEGIEDLGDATNHLSNRMASKASEITDFANRAAGAAAIFKLSATEVAAVGSAMISAGIVPETAARGFTAMATRILSGGKKVDQAFRDIGMNRKAFLKELEADAPAALQKLFTQMATSKKGMEALIEIVGRDFADDFAKFLGNPELLAEAFALIADKSAYAGSAVDEAGKQASGAMKQWDLLVNKLTRLGIVVGERLLPPLLALADRLGAVMDRVVALADANPELTQQLIQGAAAMMAFSVGMRVLGFFAAATRLSLIRLASTFLMFNASGRNIATGWRILAGAGTVLGWVFGIVKAGAVAAGAALAGLTWPIWALIAAIAAAGFALWKYWDRVSAFVSGFADGLMGAFGPAIGEAVRQANTFIDVLGKLAGFMPGELTAGISSAFETIRRLFDVTAWIEPLKAAFGAFKDWLGSFFSAEELTAEQQAAMYEAGQALAQQLMDGMNAVIQTAIAPIREAFNFALTIEWPEPPRWLLWLIERGQGAIDTVATGAAIATDAVKTATGLGEPAGVPAPAAGGGASIGVRIEDMAGFRADLSSSASAAGEALGDTAGGRMRSSAEATGEAIGRAAAAAIERATVNVRVSGGGADSVAVAATRARSGALHDGVD